MKCYTILGNMLGVVDLALGKASTVPDLKELKTSY